MRYKNKKLLEVLQVLAIIITLILLLVNPKLNMTSFYDGLILWAKFVLPALFPILFVTSILNASGIVRKLGKIFAPTTKRLFNCSGVSGYIYILSILSGYPVGAKITSELYEKGTISQAEACRITAFSSTSGPLFILGTVGVGMFNNLKLGIIVLLSHFLGALINGLIFRNLYKNKGISSFSLPPQNQPENLLETCMLSTIKSILTIGGYIALSYMLISLINSYNLLLPISNMLNNLFGIDINVSNAIFNGVIEITKGCQDISTLNLSTNLNAILSTAIISLGGVSIFLQAYTYLAKFKIKLKIYFLEKFSHMLCSVTVCAILLLIM